MKKIVILTDAAEDLEAGRDFYEEQESGVCAYFVDSLLADLEALGRFSGIHPRHHGLHRMLATHFPFGVYYRERGSESHVFAILDLRRKPGWIRKELARRA